MTHRSSARMLLLTVALSAAMAVAPLAAARTWDEEPAETNVLAGPAAMLCTLVYSPLKLTYAAGGLVVGGLAWAWSFGNKRVTRPIFRSALRGDYVVTPGHLTGERKLRFRGRR